MPKPYAPNRLKLRELLQRYADDQWVAAHLTPEQAAESVLDCFKRVPKRYKTAPIEVQVESKSNTIDIALTSK